MKKIISLSIVIFGLVLNSAVGQELNRKDFKKLFLDGEYYFLFEDYEKALSSYLKIFKADTFQAVNNANLNYKIGFCYISDPLLKSEAVPYLERATSAISFDYPIGTYKETSAPIEVYYLLGDAYRCTFEFDKAMESYQKFLDIYNEYEQYLQLDDELYDQASILNDIQACKNAKELLVLSAHNTVRVTNLGPKINSEYPEYKPVVSGDEKNLIFTSKRRYNRKKIDPEGEADVSDEYGEEEIFFSTKVDGEWTKPINISKQLKADFFTSSVSVSYDGSRLFVSKYEVLIGNMETSNIYVSQQINGKWAQLEKLNSNINTKSFESNAYLSKDGKRLYFTSDRDGGFGGMDIYYSDLGDFGDWGPAVNMGEKINSTMDEEFPFVLQDGKTIFFSSQGHYNMGGFDIFYSKMDDNGNWHTPINMGFPINSMEDNMFLMPIGDGTVFYTSLVARGGFGLEDIYRITTSASEDDELSYMSFDLAKIRDENYGHNTSKIMGSYMDEIVPNNTNDQLPLITDVDGSDSKLLAKKAINDAEIFEAKSEDMEKLSAIALVMADKKSKDADNNNDNGSDMIAIIAYNVAKKLDQSATSMREHAKNSNEFAKMIDSGPEESPEIMVQKINTNIESINKELSNAYSIENDLAETKLTLNFKSKSLDSYRDYFDKINQEIRLTETEVSLKKDSIEFMKKKKNESANKKEAKSLEEQYDKLADDLANLESQKTMVESKKTNLVTNIAKLDNEIRSLDAKLIVLEELTASFENITDETFAEVSIKAQDVDKTLLSEDVTLRKKSNNNITTIASDQSDDEISDYLAALEDKTKKFIASDILADAVKQKDSVINSDQIENILTNDTKQADAFKYLQYVRFQIVFDDGQTKPTADEAKKLDALADMLSTFNEFAVKINIDDDPQIRTLNEKRVEEIKYLLENLKTDPGKIIGPTQKVPNGTSCINIDIRSEDTKYLALLNKTDNQQPDIKNISENDESHPTGDEVEVNSILFEFDQYQIESYFTNLNTLAKYLIDNPESVIELVGYTDLQGDENYNLTLSEKRAMFIKSYLVNRNAPASNIIVKGMGENKQIASDFAPYTRKYNRRVEINVIKQGKIKLRIQDIQVPASSKIKNN